jgi:hypothetical protein
VTNPNSDLEPLRAKFEEVFAYFNDKSLFPGGATFLLNTQYGPHDQCDAPEAHAYGGPALVARLLEINRIMFLDVAEARSNTVAIDHYPDFLGHADNATSAVVLTAAPTTRRGPWSAIRTKPAARTSRASGRGRSSGCSARHARSEHPIARDPDAEYPPPPWFSKRER